MNLEVGKYSMSELLANYADKILKKGGLKTERESYEDHITHVVTLFTFLVDKDLFLMVYRNQLARRLLNDKSEDIEYERQFITQLKVTCGMS